MQGYNKSEDSYFAQNVGKKVINDRYIQIKNYDRKREFNKVSQKGEIRVVLDASYAYSQNQDVA